MRNLTWWVCASLTVAAVIAACRDVPGIDGSGVPTVGRNDAPPTCREVCDRLAALCGYAPSDCPEACADYDDGHRGCVGQARSCQEALQSCTNAPVDEAGPEGDADDDASDDGAPSDDATSEEPDAASDASDDGDAVSDAAGGG